MSEWSQGAIGTIRHPGPKQIVDRVGARAGWQAGHFAIAKVPDYAKPVIQVPCGRSPKALAVCPSWVEPDVLIAPEYFGFGVILSPDWGPPNGYKYSKNQQFTHFSSCNEVMLGFLQSSRDSSPASTTSCPLCPPEQQGRSLGVSFRRSLALGMGIWDLHFEGTCGELDGAPAAVPNAAFSST